MKQYDSYLIRSVVRTYYTNNRNIDHTQIPEDDYDHIERTIYEYNPKQLLDRIEFWINNKDVKTISFDKLPKYIKVELETYDGVANIYEYITFKIQCLNIDEVQITKIAFIKIA